MIGKLKGILDEVQAEEELKEKTKEFILQKTQNCTRTKTAGYRHFIPAVACLLFILIGGYWFYFTPTVEISIDVNPSIELGVNSFDKVISVSGYNDDGEELIKSLNIKFMDYSEAIDEILDNEKIATLLSNDEIMTIGVIGQDGEVSSRIYSDIENCISKERNSYCYYTSSKEVEGAHKMGLSYGKYRAFLEVQALDPNITADEIKGMTMREIHDLIDDLSNENNKGHGHCGNGKGYGHKQGNEN